MSKFFWGEAFVTSGSHRMELGVEDVPVESAVDARMRAVCAEGLHEVSDIAWPHGSSECAVEVLAAAPRSVRFGRECGENRDSSEQRAGRDGPHSSTPKPDCAKDVTSGVLASNSSRAAGQTRKERALLVRARAARSFILHRRPRRLRIKLQIGVKTVLSYQPC